MVSTPMQLEWHAPVSLSENESYRLLRDLCQLQDSEARDVYIDLSAVQWADSICLMQLLLALKYASVRGSKIHVQFGRVADPRGHSVFLAFLASQGFVSVFAEVAELYLARQKVAPQELQKRIAEVGAMPRLGPHVCIPVQIIDATRFANNPAELQGLVERLISMGDDLSLRSAFGSHAFARDMLFQKLRKTLFELLLNIGEHAYGTGMPAYGAVFARVRMPKPNDAAGAREWLDMLERSRQVNGNANFLPNHFTEWVELFICDIGKGLTADIERWTAGRDRLLNEAIRRAASSSNPLESIAPRLFSAPLSRNIRHESTRTSVTGLQHLGKILSVGGDYARIYSQEGMWIGSTFPWGNAADYSRKPLLDPSVGKGQIKAGPTGTAFHISIQPRHDREFLHNHPLIEPTPSILSQIRDALKGRPSSFTQLPDRTIAAVDRRIASSGYLSKEEELTLRSQAPGVLVLRPPRLMSKNDIGRWLHLTHGRLREKAELNLTCFAFVELSNFNLIALADLLLATEVFSGSTATVWLVSESWQSLELRAVDGRFQCQLPTAGKEYQGPTGFTYAELAVILREMDSELFWLDLEKRRPRQALMNIRVAWRTGSSESLSLQRYLDFPQALTDPVAFRACRRALRRLLALFPNHDLRGADELANAVLASISLPGLVQRDRDEVRTAGIVVVGSVAVTGETTREATIGKRVELVNVLHHEDAELEVFERSTAALLWITDVAERVGIELDVPDPSQKDWIRIPGTSFISNKGAHALSVLRYKRDEEGNLDFRRPLYARSPEETYDDFRRYKTLRLGHWQYGPRHDLLTVNLRSALSHAFIEQGPLYDWLKDTFADLFRFRPDGKVKAHLLVYPSHPVTDFLMDRIRQDSGFREVMPRLGMLPIKFSSERTVSPFVAFQPFQSQLEQLVERHRLTSWSAAIFDDGVLSGKHLRELSQLLLSLNASAPVRTVAIVDRSGLPSQERLIERHLSTNARFWRWDVPTLGTPRNCILCHALAISRLHATRAGNRVQTRISQWLHVWRERDSEREWYSGLAFRRSIDPPVSLAFGVYEDTQGLPTRKVIEFHDAFELVSAVVEIARLTGNVELATRKAVEIEGQAPDIALYLVATQFLLFNDELTPAKKLQHLEYLLKRLWQSGEATEASALAALCLAGCEKSLAVLIRDSVIEPWLSKFDLGSIDAVIACQFVLNTSASSGGSSEIARGSATVPTSLRNMLRLGIRSEAKAAVMAFLSSARNEAGKSSPRVHSSQLRSMLGELAQASGSTSNLRALKIVIGLLEESETALSLVQSVHLVQVPNKGLETLRQLIDVLNRNQNSPNWEIVRGDAVAAHRVLFGSGTSVKGLMSTVSEELFVSLETVDDCYLKLVRPLQEHIDQDWDRYAGQRIDTDPMLDHEAARWAKSGSSSARQRPIWAELGHFSSAPRIVYFDRFIRDAIRDLMLNVFHSSRAVGAGEIDSSITHKRHADLWWRTTMHGDFLLLEFFNVSGYRATSLKDTASAAGLERMGGLVGIGCTPINEREYLVRAFARVPTLSIFLGGHDAM